MSQVNANIHYVLTVNGREFSLILKALRRFQGQGDALAMQLEEQRNSNSASLIERLTTFINADVTAEAEFTARNPKINGDL